MPTQNIVPAIRTAQGRSEAALPLEITGASLAGGVVRYRTQMDGQEQIMEDDVAAVLSFLHVTSGRLVDVSFDPAGLVSYTLA